MSSWPESGVKLVIEVDDSQVQEAIDSLSELSNVDATVTIDADTSSLETDVSDAIPSDETVAIGAEVTPADESTSNILDSLNTLKNLKVLQTVWNIAGTALDIFGKISDFAITPMLDLDDAIAKVNAQTGNAIPNARELISGIFYDDLGDSIDQVGRLVIAAQQLGVPVEEATRAALEFTHTFKDQDPQLVLRALDQMVKNGLAPDFETAGNMAFTAFQKGANSGGDLLMVIQNNAGAIKDLGLTGPQAMALFTAGIKAGFPDVQTLLDTLIKIKQNVTLAAGNATSDVSKTLNILGIANPAETGAAWSLDFFMSVINGIKNAPVSDTDKMAMFSNIIGGKVGSKEFSNLMRLTPEDWQNVFSNISPDTMANAAETVDDSLRGALDDFWKAAQKGAEDFLSSDSIDLPGKIAALKTGLQNGLNTLAAGGSLQDALTIALKPVGLDDTFHQLEASMLDFIAGLLNVIATIQNLIPGQQEGAAATREQAGTLAGQSLQLKLEADNMDASGIVKVVNDAMKSGLDPAAFGGVLQQSVTDLVNSGDFKKAQDLLDAAKAVNVLKPTEGLFPQFNPVDTSGAIADSQKLLDDAKAKADALNTSTENRITIDDDLTQKTDTLATSTDTLATNTQTLGDNASAAAPNVEDVATNFLEVGGTAETIGPPLDDLANNAAAAVTPVANLGSGVIDMANNFVAALDTLKAAGASDGGEASTTPTHIGIGGQATGTDSASGTFMVGEAGPEIVTSNRSLAVLNNKTTAAIMAALQGYIPGGGGSRSIGSKNVVVNQNNYVPNQAIADALGYRTAALVRGV